MYVLKNIEGIVLKTQDYGETNKIVTIFSKQIGKISAIARGAKKAKSRMAAVSQVFIHGEFQLFIGKGLGTMQQGQINQSFRHIGADIEKTAYAAYITELTDRLLDDREPDRYIYDQLLYTLEWINEHDDFYVPIFMYELKLFAKGGFSPVLNRCVHCSKTAFPFAFSIEEGGLLCTECRHLDEYAVGLQDRVVKLLYNFQRTGLDKVGNISIKQENIRFLRQLLNEYYDKYGGFQLKSKRFLAQLDQLK